jgi:hypothetical protein
MFVWLAGELVSANELCFSQPSLPFLLTSLLLSYLEAAFLAEYRYGQVSYALYSGQGSHIETFSITNPIFCMHPKYESCTFPAKV